MAAPALSNSRAAEILRRLEMTVYRRLDGLLQGDYRGLVPGHGSESGETRPYTAGDDVRRIDWNVSARSIDTHVRESIADRELETWLLIDRSPSLDFGTASMTKAELAVSAVGAIGFLTAKTGNRLGAVVVDPNGSRIVPAKPGRDHLLALLHGLVVQQTHPTSTAVRAPSGPDREPSTTQLGHALGRLVVPPRRRGLVVVVSDFLSSDPWDPPLRALATRHDVVAIEIIDPRELELPAVGMLTVVDPETGRTRDVPTNRRTRARYAAAAAEQRADIADRLRRSGVGHLQLRTDSDWVLDFVRFVSSRKRTGAVR